MVPVEMRFLKDVIDLTKLSCIHNDINCDFHASIQILRIEPIRPNLIILNYPQVQPGGERFRYLDKSVLDTSEAW
jgi:hypothetical protein